MPQPKSKAQIIKRLGIERKRLVQCLSALSQQDMLQRGVVGEWSVKDVLAHLADWEAHMPVWVEAARRGDPVPSPDPGLTWDQLDIFNERIYAVHCDQALDDVLDYFHTTHTQFMEMVEAMPVEEMLTCGFYAFTGEAAVYNWLVSYAKHDLWGRNEILRWLKARELSIKG